MIRRNASFSYFLYAAIYFPDFLEVIDGRDYQKLKVFTKGAMGEIWYCKAKGQNLVERAGNKYCVAKVTKKGNDIPWEAFQQEVTISYHLREHPNIAQIIGFSREPFSLLMRFYPYGSLSALIHDCKVRGFEWSYVWSGAFATDIASGLGHMHSLSIVHGDIKPGNVLIHQEGETLVALLTDFGISRILDDKSNVVAGFQSHNLNGASFPYAGPEVLMFLRTNTISEASADILKAGDVYSLAAVMYEMLTKRKPWG